MWSRVCIDQPCIRASPNSVHWSVVVDLAFLGHLDSVAITVVCLSAVMVRSHERHKPTPESARLDCLEVWLAAQVPQWLARRTASSWLHSAMHSGTGGRAVLARDLLLCATKTFEQPSACFSLSLNPSVRLNTRLGLGIVVGGNSGLLSLRLAPLATQLD